MRCPRPLPPPSVSHTTLRLLELRCFAIIRFYFICSPSSCLPPPSPSSGSCTTLRSLELGGPAVECLNLRGCARLQRLALNCPHIKVGVGKVTGSWQEAGGKLSGGWREGVCVCSCQARGLKACVQLEGAGL